MALMTTQTSFLKLSSTWLSFFKFSHTNETERHHSINHKRNKQAALYGLTVIHGSYGPYNNNICRQEK